MLVGVFCGAPCLAHANCFSEVQQEDGALAAEIRRNPAAAIASIQAQLRSAETGTAASRSRARLYALLMDAYADSGDIVAARSASDHGIESLTNADGSQLRRRLQLTGIMLLQVQGRIDRAATEYEQASALVPQDAPDFVCVMGDRGYLRYLVGRKADAVVDAMRAYRLAADRHLDSIRLSAGQLLARLYAQYDLYDEAHALADEAVAFYKHTGQTSLLSDAYLFRGDVLLSEHDYAAAEADFQTSRGLLQGIGDRFAESYTRQRLCTVSAQMADRSDATRLCDDAYAFAKSVNNTISAKLALVALGQLRSANGHPREAIELWNRALAQDGVDLPRRTRAEIFKWRSAARASLGDSALALNDMSRFVDSLAEERGVRSADQLALLKSMFDSSLKTEELARVRAEARVAELGRSRELMIRNMISVCALASLALLGVGMWSWHRRRLAIQANTASRETLAMIGRLTGGVAHDFNNLLTVLQQTFDLLAHRPTVRDDPNANELLRQARQATVLCSDITSQLLSVGRQQNLKPEALDLDRYLREELPLLERTAGTAVKVHIECGRPQLGAWVDRRQLTAALMNLVGNARDAMPDGGRLTIRTNAAAADKVRVDVIDTGHGMTPDVLQHAVEPFYTTKEIGTGSGLGLSSVHGFATQSGGALEISSKPDQGTIVSLWLPSAALDP